MKPFFAELRRKYERLRSEQLPLATLLQAESPGGIFPEPSHVQEIREAEIAGVKCDFLPMRPGIRWKFRTRVRPHSSLFAWAAIFSGNGDATVNVQIVLRDQVHTIAEIPVRRSSKLYPQSWRRVRVDLSPFAHQDITLLLSVHPSTPDEELVVKLGDPRIVRWRSPREYRTQLQSRLAEGGLGGVGRSIRAIVKGKPRPLALFSDYERWVKENTLTPAQLAQMAESSAAFGYRPLISVVTPTFNTDPGVLRCCIGSVQSQSYSNWELCICDDGSTSEPTRQTISECAQSDPRIKVNWSASNRGICEATNSAIRLSSGAFIGFLDHDDVLSPDALFESVRLLQDHPEADVIYSDEDKLESDGTRSEPFFKPDWSPELLLSGMYTCHFSLYRKELVEAVGGLRTGFEGSQDYDLILRVAEHTSNIFHIPKILYHWRKVPNSTAEDPRAKASSTNIGLRALQEHFERIRVAAEIMPTDVPNSYRVRPSIQGNPLVSIIIPHKDHPEMLANCIRSVRERTTYSNYELMIVDNGSSSTKAQEYLRSLPYRVIPFNEPFNFSRLNNIAIRESRGDYALLLNDDTEVISSDWLSAMLGYAQVPEIGAVGAKLFFADGSIQHCGVVLGIRGVAGHWLRRFPGHSRGYFNSLFRTRNFSAVTAACVLFRRDVFESVGGFDENLPYAFNDVDFCLRIRSAGYRIAWVPDAELYHYETVTRPLELDPREVRYLKKKWGNVLMNDPYYNVNLGLDSEALSLRW